MAIGQPVVNGNHKLNEGYQTPEEVSFDAETGYVVAQLNKADYRFKDKPVRFQGKTFEPKEELHITIASRDVADRLSEHLQQHPEDENRVWRAIQAADWSYSKSDRFYYVVEEPGVETIIQMVDTPGVKSFFQQLSRIVDGEIELPPTHVTLYTRGTSNGIGLPTQAVFDRLAQRQIDPQELEYQE